MPNTHMKPCPSTVRFEFIGELRCSLGEGHERPHHVDRSTIDVARLCGLSQYESALQRIAGMWDGTTSGDIEEFRIARKALEMD